MELANEYGFINTLITQVERNKCIYDKSDGFYYNKIEKAKVWSEIAQVAEKSEAECRNKWKLLRERFARELRKREMSPNSGFCESDEWQYFKSMQFLTNSVKPRRPLSYEIGAQQLPVVIKNDPLSFEEESYTSTFECNPETSSPPTPSRKRKALKPLDKLCHQFEKTIKKMEENLATELSQPQPQTQPPPKKGTDAFFMQTIVSLMEDLPVPVKDKFQCDMFQAIMKLRDEVRCSKDKK